MDELKTKMVDWVMHIMNESIGFGWHEIDANIINPLITEAEDLIELS